MDLDGQRLFTADDLCKAAEAALRAGLPALAELAGLQPVQDFQQLPTEEALTSANVPAIAITSPGLVSAPRHRPGTYDATWRLAIAVYDRGSDHASTQTNVRTWGALVRAVLVQNRSLSGTVETLRWVGEEYALRPERSSARTLGGAAVAFDVDVNDVVSSLAGPQPTGSGPSVIATASTVTVRPRTT